MITKHNAEATHSYTLEINKFADFTAEEFNARYNGFRSSANLSVVLQSFIRSF